MKSFSTPLLSVIIPTHKRPHFLPQAIESALQAAPDSDVEVVVVPNGPDDSWKNVAQDFFNQKRVKWHHLKNPNGNAARNYGMLIAKGKYIRFLDDDDFFYPNHAKEQIEQLINSKNQLSQGAVALISENEEFIKKMSSNIDLDFAYSMLLPSRMTLPCSFIFEKKILKNHLWNESRKFSQDVAFALELASKGDFTFNRYDNIVAAWRQHNEARISSQIITSSNFKSWSEIILKTAEQLHARNVLNNARKQAASNGVWECIHHGFIYSPIYWSKFIINSPDFIKHSKPRDNFFYSGIGKSLPPLLWEWLMLPHRFIRRKIKTSVRNVL